MQYLTIDYSGKIGKTDNPYLQSGTCLQDEIQISYKKLAEVFGKQNVKGDKEKTDAEWIIITPAGVATIYNYKDGKNYLGKEGLKIVDIENWHIGGHTKEVVFFIKKALGIEI